MALLVRIVVPGVPHHVAARGNRREPIFFEDGDQELYGDLLGEHLRQARVSLWAYCLMPNHVHLIVCPETTEVLARALGGAIFDGRYASLAMDEDHLLAGPCAMSLSIPCGRGSWRGPRTGRGPASMPT